MKSFRKRECAYFSQKMRGKSLKIVIETTKNVFHKGKLYKKNEEKNGIFHNRLAGWGPDSYFPDYKKK